MCTRDEATHNLIEWIGNDEGLYRYCKDLDAKSLEEYFTEAWKVEHPMGFILYITPDGYDLNLVNWDKVEEHVKTEEEECCPSCDEPLDDCECERCEECTLLVEDCTCERKKPEEEE